MFWQPLANVSALTLVTRLTLKHRLTLPVPIPDKEKKLSQIFIFTLLCGTSEGFMKALKATQRSVKIKI